MDSVTNVQWRNITGIEGYQVSDTGLIKSLPKEFIDKRGRLWRRHGKMMKLQQDKLGYKQILLSYPHGTSKLYKVHRLVATEFISNPHNYPEVNHLNGNKSDNRKDNLEWTTHSGNIKHAYDIGLLHGLKGQQNPSAKLKDLDLPHIADLRKQGISFQKIAEQFGVTKTCIQLAMKRYAKQNGEWVK